MELPAALRAAVDRELEGIALADLQRAASLLSARYRAETRDGKMHLDAEIAVRAYLATRLPATFAAVRMSFEAAAEALPDFRPRSMLDVGAGPGTALWAASECWESLHDATMLEGSREARVAGQKLARALGRLDMDWIGGDALTDLAISPPADLVSLCYVLDELRPAAIPALIEKLWSLARGVLVIVEPGTPAGWRRVLTARTQLIAAGAHIGAPCPHEAPCPIVQPDWCHFARRVARSRLHRLAKAGDAPFEDEKFIYLVASRFPVAERQPRVLAPPRAGKAWVDLKLCLSDGEAATVQVTKRQGESYRTAKKLEWGDLFETGAGGYSR